MVSSPSYATSTLLAGPGGLRSERRMESPRSLLARGPERRASERFPMSVPCTLCVDDRDYGLFWTENIATGGALLRCGGTFDLDHRVRLIAHFPWFKSIAVDATATHRTDTSGGRTLVGFRFENQDVTGVVEMEDAVRMRAAAEPQARRDLALVMTDDAEIWHSLRRDLAGLGVDAKHTPRPLDVIWSLADWLGRAAVLFVNPVQVGEHVIEWFRFLDEAFPETRRVWIAETAVPEGGSKLLVSRRIHGLLAVPWNPSSLQEFFV